MILDPFWDRIVIFGEDESRQTIFSPSDGRASIDRRAYILLSFPLAPETYRATFAGATRFQIAAPGTYLL